MTTERNQLPPRGAGGELAQDIIPVTGRQKVPTPTKVTTTTPTLPAFRPDWRSRISPVWGELGLTATQAASLPDLTIEYPLAEGTFAPALDRWQYEHFAIQRVMQTAAMKDAANRSEPSPFGFTEAMRRVLTGLVLAPVGGGGTVPVLDRTEEGVTFKDLIPAFQTHLERAEYMMRFYDLIPSDAQRAGVGSLEDWFRLFQSQTGLGQPSYLTPADLSEMERAIGWSKAGRGPGTDPSIYAEVNPDDPEFLKFDPDDTRQQEETREFVTGKIKVQVQPMHRISVNEIISMLAASGNQLLIPSPPTGMSDTDVLDVMKYLDIPEDISAEAANYLELTLPYREAALAQSEKIAEVLAGLSEWELPDMSTMDRLKFTMMSPYQTIADIIQPYLTEVSYPLSGIAAYSVSKFLPGQQDIEKQLAIARRDGEDPWHAFGVAWEETDMNMWAKLAIEIAVDPLTYLPGLGLSLPGKALSKAGFRTAGAALLSANEAAWRVSDIPFNAMKKQLARLPKVFSQKESILIGTMKGNFFNAVTAHTGKGIKLWTADDLIDTLEASRAAFRQFPEAVDSPQVLFGADLATISPIGRKEILEWAKQAGGGLTEVTPQILDDINIQLTLAAGKGKPIDQVAKELSLHFWVESTEDNITKLSQQIKRYLDKFSNKVDDVIKVGKTTEISPVPKMMNLLFKQQKKITSDILKSEWIKDRQFISMSQKLVNIVDKVEASKYKVGLDRWWIKPFATAYLGTLPYTAYNAMEGAVVQALEGIFPGMAGRAELELMFKGTRGLDFAMASWILEGTLAGEISGLKLRHAAGKWTFLPGDIPETILGRKVPDLIAGRDFLKYLGRHWVDRSDEIGTGQRAHFLSVKMRQYLANASHDVDGVDINAIMSKLIEPMPKFSKHYLGVKPKDLRTLASNWFYSGDSSITRAGGKAINNGSMLIAEQVKILRQSLEFSPAALELGSQTISKGAVLESEKSIVDFATGVANRTLDDVSRNYKTTQETFSTIADGLTSKPINNVDDLVEVFRNYEVMYETAGNLPHKILSDVWPEIEELRKLKKWGSIRSTWELARSDLQLTMDSIFSSMDNVRKHIFTNAGILPDEQRIALETIMGRSANREQVWNAAFDADKKFLDDWWKLGRGTREGQYDDFWAMRAETWENYRKAIAVIGGSELQMRTTYAKLYRGLPPLRLSQVDVTGGELAINDIAKIMGCNVDTVTSTVAENMAMQDKHMFVQMVFQQAEAYPKIFKGVTEEKLYKVYDRILETLRFNKVDDIAKQRVWMQAEGLKDKLISLRANSAMSASDTAAFDGWVEGIAKGMDDTFGKGKAVPSRAWNDLRQQASESAHKEYYKAYADYDHGNIVSAVGRTIFPFWTYSTYRWNWLARTGIRHPGTATAWAKYYNYTDYGHVQIPGTDFSINPFVGSVGGATFGLARKDFVGYWEHLPWGMGEVLDTSQRWSFYPGPHVMAVVALTPLLDGRPSELGEILPPIVKFGLNALIGSDIPMVSEGAQYLTDRVFHENFRDYYVTTRISQRQVLAGGTLIDGQSGADLMGKKRRGEAFTDEEQQIWDSSSGDVGWYYALRSQFAFNRFKPQELLDAYKVIEDMIEAGLGVTAKQQDWAWKHNMRPTDIVGGIPEDLSREMDEIWQWKIWFGRGQVLMPPDIQDIYDKQNKYYSRVKTYQDTRLAAQVEKDGGYLRPTDILHLSRREWRSQYAENWSVYINNVEALEEDPEYTEAIEMMTEEGKVEMAKRLRFAAPVTGPIQEAINLYFTIELVKKPDPYTGQTEWDYLGFWLNRDAVRMALTEDQLAEFDATIKKYETPMERIFRYATDKYIRGYRAVPRVVFETYPEEYKVLIKEHYADGTTTDRKDEIKAIASPDGRLLISAYESDKTEARRRLRILSPTLDYYLYCFGYTDKPLTPLARSMTDEFDRDRTTILTR